jgi:DNA-binding IclR family transcriptional regulator
MTIAMKRPLKAQDTDRSQDKAQEKSQVQVIARAAAIMRALEDTTTGLSLAEIAMKVGLARSTVQRIVSALETEKLVVAASPAGRVRLGPTILRLAGSVRTDFVALARPFLVELSKELHETVDLASIKGDHLVFIDQVIGSQRLRTVSAVGESFPLYCTANGKAYLATLDDEAIEALIGKSYKARTPHTITKLAQLLEDIHAVRRNGYALDLQEHALGICAVGVAMRDMLGNYVAISVPVPAQRFEQERAHICERLLATKHTLESHSSTTH